MEKDKKYIFIFLAKVLFVVLVPCMAWVDFTLFVFSAFMPYLTALLALLLVIILGELFPGGRKGKGFFIRHIRQPLILAGCMIASVFLNIGIYRLKDKISQDRYYEEKRIESEQIMEFKSQAEVIIPIGNTHHVDGYGYTDIESDVIMIDYDTMRMAFLTGYISEPFVIVQLTEGERLTDKNIQCTIELDEPGAEFISIADEERDWFTSAIQITMADGRVFTATDLKSKDGDDSVYLELK